jgi:hypothetical protein
MRKYVRGEGRGFKCSTASNDINPLQPTEVLKEPLYFSCWSREWEGEKRRATPIHRKRRKFDQCCKYGSRAWHRSLHLCCKKSHHHIDSLLSSR